MDCTALPASRSTRCTLLPRVVVTHIPPLAPRARPAGWAAPFAFGGRTGMGGAQAYLPSARPRGSPLRPAHAASTTAPRPHHPRAPIVAPLPVGARRLFSGPAPAKPQAEERPRSPLAASRALPRGGTRLRPWRAL